MRELGIRGATRERKRFTTKSDPEAIRAPDLVKRDFTAIRPNEKWVADFTYCSTWSGIVYVAFVVDIYSRRIVGLKAARSMTASLVVDAMNMADWSRRHVGIDGVIVTRTPGVKYTSVAYTERLAEVGAAPSIGTSATATTTPWPRPPSGCSRWSCSGTRRCSRPTADHGEGSTTSRSERPAGSAGSTTSASTPSSTTAPRPRSKPTTTITSLSPMRLEKPNHQSLYETWTGSKCIP